MTKSSKITKKTRQILGAPLLFLGLPVLLLLVANEGRVEAFDLQSLAARRVLPTTTTTTTTTLGVALQPEQPSSASSGHSPLYSLQLVNAVPVTRTNAQGQTVVWRPLVSRVTRVARRVVTTKPAETGETHRTESYAAVRWSRKALPSNSSSSSSSSDKNKKYQATLRAWMQRVMTRKSSKKEAQAPQQATAAETETIDHKTAKNDDTLWQESLASQDAGVSQQRIQQPLPPQYEAQLAAKYAAIDDVQERAFVILKDLGVVEPSLDFTI